MADTVVYSCPFVSAEWIAAHSLRPSRLLPDCVPPGSAAPPEGFCPYAWAFIHAVGSVQGVCAVVLTTTCDQMRRAAERLVRITDLPVFVMNVPATWQTTAAHRMYVGELRRLGRFLESMGGVAPCGEELADVMRDFDARRAVLRASRGRLSPRQFSEAVARFHEDGVAVSDLPERPVALHGVPVALVGSPMIRGHWDIFDIISRTGGTVVLDGTTSGERCLVQPFDRRLLSEDPLRALTDAYFGQIPDAFRRPNSQLYEWLKRKLAERGVRGLIFRAYAWCDTWRAEAERIKEWADIPVLSVTTGADGQTDGHLTSRIESFIEMLQ